jgi:PST family polysaccharide transporter
MHSRQPPLSGDDRNALKRRSADGAVIALGSQVGKLAVQLIYQVLLARYLLPSDFGLVAMAAPVLAFVQLFADLGLSQATIQRAEITQRQLSLMFWVNVAASTLFGLITIALAPLVALFYGESRVAAVTAAFGAMLLFSGLSSQHLALLNRNMAFSKLACVEVFALVSGAAAGLTAASRELGYWSIPLGQGVTAVVTLILAWLLSGWHPGKPQGEREWRSLIGFGGNLTGFNLCNYFARNLDNVLIGKVLGEAALGLYDRAYRLMTLPMNQVSQPISRVALPLLARSQDHPEDYRKAYVRTLDLVLALTYPFAAFAVVTNEQLIRYVLGERWAGVAPIFAILGVGALFAPLGNSTGWLFISQNRTRQMRNYGVLSSALFVMSFAIGLPWGPVGVAACYVGVGIFVQGPLVLWAATREGPVRLPHVLRGLAPHLLSLAIGFGAEIGLQRLLPTGLPSLAFLLLAAYAVYVAALAILPSGREILNTLRNYGGAAASRLGR